MSETEVLEWEAAEWVARRMGDEPFDQGAFRAWLAGDARREPLFDLMWRRIMGPQVESALDSFVRQHRAHKRWLAGGIAAMLALVGGLQALPSLELLATPSQRYVAADGAIRTIRLADGSRLTLAGGAEIDVRYTRHRRQLELTRGTIFAEVRHDAARPFAIVTGDARITDIGTRFEVAKKDDGLRVTVESGVIRLGTGGWFGAKVDLGAAQAAELREDGLHRVDAADRGRIARWRAGWAEYRDAPLAEVIADLDSVSALPIRLTDKGLAARRVSGRIRLVDPAKQIDNLSILYDFAVVRRNGVILLSDRRIASLSG